MRQCLPHVRCAGQASQCDHHSYKSQYLAGPAADMLMFTGLFTTPALSGSLKPGSLLVKDP